MIDWCVRVNFIGSMVEKIFLNKLVFFVGFQSRCSHLHGMPARNIKKASGNQNALVGVFIFVSSCALF